MKKAIAIDFDGCLCENKYPAIGVPYWTVINMALDEQRNGAGLILWTCREGELLEQAIAACKSWGLTFEAVNESLPEWISAWGTRPRKVGATEYWDDRALRIPDTKCPCRLRNHMELEDCDKADCIEYCPIPMRQDAEKNKPLTTEELRQMAQQCEGVYVARLDGRPIVWGRKYCAAILDIKPTYGGPDRIQAIYGDKLTLWEDDYAKTWIAYSRPPVEEINIYRQKEV